MGMTPAAITLAESGFDLPALLRQATYEEGGPNTHASSLYTIVTAAMIALMGGYDSSLPALHLLSFLAAAGLAAAVFVIAHRITESAGTSAFAALITVLYPPVLVQASDVYLDLPLAAAMMWSIALGVQRRYRLAILAATVAVWIKPTGIIVLPVLAYILHRSTLASRTRRATTGLLVLPLLFVLVPLITSAQRRTASGLSAVERIAQSSLATAWYASQVPGLILLLVATAIALLVHRQIGPRQENIASADASSAVLTGVLSTIAFYLLNPLVTSGFALLPRYTVTLAPLLAILISTGMHRTPPVRSTAIGLGLAGGLLVLSFGWLGPSPSSNYAVSERDLRYEDHLAVQAQAIRELERLSRTLPVFYDHFTYFRFKYPEMGWVESDRHNGTAVHLAEPGTHTLDSMPEEFALLFEHPWLGGKTLRAVWHAAQASDQHVVEVHVHESGGFENHVVVIREIDSLSS